MVGIAFSLRPLAIVLLLGCFADAAHAASEVECAAIADRRARLRCTDDFAVSLGSRAKVAVRQTLKNPDSAVFSALRLVPGTHDEALCGRVEVEGDDGRLSGPQDFAFDSGVAYVLLKNAARDGVAGSTADERIAALGRNIEKFIALCGPGLPQFRR